MAAVVVGCGLTACSGRPPTAGELLAASPDLTPAAGRASAPRGSVLVAYPDGTGHSLAPVAMRDLPRTRVTAADGSTVTGVSLPTLTAYDGPPATPPVVAAMRTSYFVVGDKGTVRLTRAETEPTMGAHPALLTEQADGRIDLVVSQDATTARSVLGVRQVTVDWADTPTAVEAPARGAVLVRRTDSSETTVLPMAGISRSRYDVVVRGSAGVRHHTEMGFDLATALRSARIPLRSDTLVTVVSSSGATASVTLGEVTSARKHMGFSFVQDGLELRQPTFIVDGDASGVRTISDVTQLVVTPA